MQQHIYRLKVQTKCLLFCWHYTQRSQIWCRQAQGSPPLLYILLVRYRSDHHGDKPFHDAVAIEPIEMLRLCTLFIFALWYETHTKADRILRFTSKLRLITSLMLFSFLSFSNMLFFLVLFHLEYLNVWSPIWFPWNLQASKPSNLAEWVQNELVGQVGRGNAGVPHYVVDYPLLPTATM